MQRVSGSRNAWPLLGPVATRALERAAQAALAPHTLMQRAGAAIARLAQAIAPHAPSVQLWCGPGNNGGDGLEAAMWLARAGRRVRVVLLADAGRLPTDAAASLQRAREAGVPIIDRVGAAGVLDDEALQVDALLGLGSNRAPAGALAEAAALLQADSHRLVLAIDQPSGLDVATGTVLGPVAVHASHTLALLSLKPGLFTGAGRDHAGELWFDPIGVEGQAASADAWLADALDPLDAQPRAHASHKGSFGDVEVIGGAPGMAGAALLAARAALAAGAGRVYLRVLDAGFRMPDSQQPELMYRAPTGGSSAGSHGTVLLCGCGGGDAVAPLLPAALSNAGRLVLDADALNAVAGDPMLGTLLGARAARGLTTVLTPHPLEAARLLGTSAAAVQADRLAATAALCERTRAIVVLKGSGSVVAAPGRLPSINPTGNAALATAGTGDVLAGWLAGRWAAGGAQASDVDAARAVALAATYRHGLAAHGALTPLRASALIERLHALG